MKGSNNSSVWLDAGYDLFAREGSDGLQIERLSRVAGLNKSGFYHFFGDMEGFSSELLELHKKKAHNFTAELKEIKTIEPDYLNLLVRYKTPVLFQMHLTRNKTNSDFQKMVELVYQLQYSILSPVWCAYLEVDQHSDVGMQYFNIVRDTFHSRVTFQNFSYELLQSIVSEARTVLNRLSDQKNLSFEAN